MAEHVTEKDVRDIATYTRIGMTDEEVAAMTVDLNNIIDSLKPITEYDLEGVEPTFDRRTCERDARRRGADELFARNGARERTEARRRLLLDPCDPWRR